jgi:hypothetical protein
MAFSGTYPLIYSNRRSFYMWIHYMQAYFWSPYLSNITRSTCILIFYASNTSFFAGLFYSQREGLPDCDGTGLPAQLRNSRGTTMFDNFRTRMYDSSRTGKFCRPFFGTFLRIHQILAIFNFRRILNVCSYSPTLILWTTLIEQSKWHGTNTCWVGQSR